MTIHDACSQWSLTGLIDNLNNAAANDEDENHNDNLCDNGNQTNSNNDYDDDGDFPGAIASWKHTKKPMGLGHR